MLFMVMESFRNRNLVGERFARQGRMLPEGVTYHASWMDLEGSRCFQLMEAPNQESLGIWLSRWSDLVDFEVVPVTTSAEFWSKAPGQPPQ